MGVLSVLLKRAQEWPAKKININDVTDRTKRYFLDITPTLRPENILTPEEVAERLKVPSSWVYEKTRARCRNPIPCLRLGRYIRFDWNAVINWLTVEAEQNAARPSLQKKR
ncbi:MAG: helix-turn-helix domain-containing protein [Candidatus Acidiferrales bacterium]|jgi:excisionase family DNA binding protein